MPYPCCCDQGSPVVDCPLCIDGTTFQQVKLTIAGVTGASAGYNGEYILDNTSLGISSCEWQWTDGDIFLNFIINLTATVYVTYSAGFYILSPFSGTTWTSAGIASDEVEDDCDNIDAMTLGFNGNGADWASATVLAEWL